MWQLVKAGHTITKTSRYCWHRTFESVTASARAGRWLGVAPQLVVARDLLLREQGTHAAVGFQVRKPIFALQRGRFVYGFCEHTLLHLAAAEQGIQPAFRLDQLRADGASVCLVRVHQLQIGRAHV